MQPLGESDLDPLAVVGHGATATGTLHDSIVAAATTAAGTAVHEVIAVCARLGAGVLALEDAGVHVGSALGADHADVAAVHVDVAGNIESTVDTEGDLGPGLLKTTKQGKLGALLGGRASSRDVGREGEADGLASLEADGDVGGVVLDDHTSEAVGLPAVENGLLTTVVGDVHSPGTVVSDPDAAVIGLAVHTHLGADDAGDASDTGEDIGNDVAEVLVGCLDLGGWGRGLGGLDSLCAGGGHRAGGLLLGLGGRAGGSGGGLLLLGSRGRLCGGRRRGEDGAPVDLVPLDILEVVRKSVPVDGLLGAALGTADCQCLRHAICEGGLLTLHGAHGSLRGGCAQRQPGQRQGCSAPGQTSNACWLLERVACEIGIGIGIVNSFNSESQYAGSREC
jgi:hypothetical protein